MPARRSTHYLLVVAGSNSDGQLSLGHREDTNVFQKAIRESNDLHDTVFPPPGWKIHQLSSGSGHTVAIIAHESSNSAIFESSSQVWYVGSNANGQLGVANAHFSALMFSLVDLNDLLGRRTDHHVLPKMVSCGWDWTVIVLDGSHGNFDDEVVVLGTNNDFGQLGIGKGKTQEAVHSVALIPSDIKLDRRVHVETVACGVRHSLVICTLIPPDDHEYRHVLLAWGAARHGQCGQVQSAGTGHKAESVIWKPRIVKQWSSTTFVRGDNRVQVAAGKEHSLVCVPLHWSPLDGEEGMRRYEAEEKNTIHLYGFGSSKYGQLDVFDMRAQSPSNCHGNAYLSHGLFPRTLSAQCTWNGTSILQWSEEKNVVRLSGNNSHGQLANHQETGTSTQCATIQMESAHSRETCLACGSEHGLLLVHKERLSSPTVYGWGWNEHGNLGQGDQEDRLSLTRIPFSDVDGISVRPRDVWAGCGTSFVQVTRDSAPHE